MEIFMQDKTPFLGPKRGEEILKKIESLEGEDASAKDYLTRLYSILTILDGKANGLLRVNSLFLTMLIFFIGWSNAPTGFPTRLADYVPLAYINAFLLVGSSVLCLLVVSVSWKFLGHANQIKDRYSFDTELARLANVVDDRTHYYWIAWLFTLIALLISLLWMFAFVRRIGGQIIRSFI
jgi:hypothetical protein